MRIDYNEAIARQMQRDLLSDPRLTKDDRIELEKMLDILSIADSAALPVVIDHAYKLGRFVSRLEYPDLSRMIIDYFYLELQQHMDDRYVYNAQREMIRRVDR